MYRISLDQFEGPLDLLLFFIKRDEIDIYDIPIARITDEFLEYVRLMEKVDLDGVGDFIYMASLLINIKARLLLPEQETDEEGEPVDPRRELVERLLEYVRFKEAADQLEEKERQRSEQFTRGDAAAPPEEWKSPDEAELDVSLYELVHALEGVLVTDDEESDEPVHEVEPFGYTVEGQREYLIEQLISGERVSFKEICKNQNKPFVIATFLAVLELARQRFLWISIEPGVRDFELEVREDYGQTDISELISNGSPTNGTPEQPDES